MTATDLEPPRVVRVAAGLVATEGAVLVALSVVYAGFIGFGDPHRRGLALFIAAIGFAFGLALLLAARGLYRRRRAAYSPIVLLQMLALPVGIGLIQGGDQPWIAVAVLVPSLVVLGLLVGTPSGRSMHEDRGD